MDYIFVSGCGHSGTSLLAAILGAHPYIYAIPFETKAFLDDISEGRTKIENFGKGCTKPGVRYICEKTPAHVLKSDEILKAFPEAKLLFIVRDPRDVVASFKRRGMEVNYGINRWRRACNAIIRVSVLPNAYIVKYEDLIADSKRVLEEICVFLDISYDSSMLEYWKDDREWFGVHERSKPESVKGKNHIVYRNWQIHQPIMTNTIGSYMNTLSKSEISSVEERLRSLALRFQYKIAFESAMLGPGEPI